MSRNKLILLAAMMLLLGIVFAAASHLDTSSKEPVLQTQPTQTVPSETTIPETEPATEPETEATTVPTEPEPESFTLTFVGDCTLGCSDAHRYTSGGFTKVVGEDYDYPFRNVAEYFENDDFTMINLEGVLGESGYAVDKAFNFRGPSEYINILTGSSVEAVTLANNHARDYGQKGYDSTTQLLTDADITYVEKDGTALFTTESGLTIGLYATSFTIYQDDLAEAVASLREQGADIVVFAIHWGSEGAYAPQTHQTKQAYAAIDAGVDIVYGTHPHVLQKIEEYNGGIIYYSLGNFCFGGNQQPADLDTVVLQQEVIRNPDGSVELGELTIIPASISSIPVKNNYQPTPYEVGTEEYQRVLSKLDGTFK